jgi:hypothetical protein
MSAANPKPMGLGAIIVLLAVATARIRRLTPLGSPRLGNLSVPTI